MTIGHYVTDSTISRRRARVKPPARAAPARNVKILGVKALLPWLLLASLAACRKDEISVRVEAKEAPASALGASPAAARPHGVRWTAPRGWKDLPGAGMRVATLQPPASSGKAEATVTAFPGGVGGELANVNRWRGQIALPPLAEADLPAARRSVRCPLGEIAVYDFTGGGAKPTRLVAGMISVRGTTWFFKLMGDAPAVAADKPAFLRLLEGLASDES
jgi:hypothetical protein